MIGLFGESMLHVFEVEYLREFDTGFENLKVSL